jgi:hypothetical protein
MVNQQQLLSPERSAHIPLAGQSGGKFLKSKSERSVHVGAGVMHLVALALETTVASGSSTTRSARATRDVSAGAAREAAFCGGGAVAAQPGLIAPGADASRAAAGPGPDRRRSSERRLPGFEAAVARAAAAASSPRIVLTDAQDVDAHEMV